MRFEVVEEPGVELEVAFRIEVEDGELKVFPKAAERERERVSVWGLLEFFLPPFTVLSTQLDC
jgi:hypothetical protein